MLKIIESVLMIMILLQRQRGQLAFSLVPSEKQPFSGALEKYNLAVKSDPIGKVHINYRLLFRKQNEAF